MRLNEANIRRMADPATFTLSPDDGSARVVLAGDWTALSVGRAQKRLWAALRGVEHPIFDVSGIGRFDTVAAYILLHSAPAVGFQGERPDVRRMIDLVAGLARQTPKAPGRSMPSVYAVFVRAGLGVEQAGQDVVQTLAFLGRLLATIGAVVVRPQRIRLAASVALMERAGLDALPIIAVTNFFIGATVAFLGASLLSQFGASVFTVELIGVAMLREFGVLITAVLLAGRSASSFAAELGAMKMNQEVDAMEVLGVDPFLALVLPRFSALLTMTPLLTFVADVAGLTGGLIVTWGVLGLSPSFFLQRLLDNVGVLPLYLGLAKAPVMAVVIAAIGCRQGLEVGGDVEQLGRRVTTAVVQAIFSIIVIDAAFAMIFMELGL
jgi:phospholipid/cholesterol/gamma-HCH transport system permease protein